MTVLEITYTPAGGGGSTTYTVTYDCNGGTSGCPENVTGIEAGTTITLADGPVKEDYLFAGWNDGENTYDEGDEYDVNGNVTFTAQWEADPNAPQYEWVLTDLANLSSSDVFVIVGNNGSNYAMANDGGTTSAPSAVAVTVANNKVTSTVAANIKWNISGDATDGYVFYPNGSTETWLYCTSENNGVRVGTTSTNNYNKFKLQSNYIYNIGRTAYLGVYNSQDWRRYTSINANIQNQTFAFYKRQVVSTDPAIYASNVNIAYNDLEGEIEYTLENEVTGGELTASTTSDWLTLPQTFASPITFTATKNTMTEARTATVTLTYTYGNNQSISKDVTVTQGAHPTTYTTIEALFNAAGSTATEVFVTFGGWVVSGVSTNGYNVFVTDGTNGFVINGGDHGFVVGNTLTSTTPIACTLQKSNGYAKVTGINASTEDLTVGTGGTVTVADIAMADLTGINTGALVHYENLTCSVSTNSSGTTTYYHLSDGTTSIQVYNALFAFEALEDGHTYNITGVYQQYSSTKEILPRSAADIEEVVITTPSITLASYVINVDSDIHQEFLDVTFENFEPTTGYAFTCDANGTFADYSWLVAELDINNNKVRCTIGNNEEEEARTGYFKVKCGDVYSDIVTVNQAAYVPPFASATYTLASSIESGKTYIISDGTDRAMGAQSGNIRSAAAVTIEGDFATVESEDVYEFVISGSEIEGYTIFDARTPGYLYASSSSSNNIGTRENNDDDNGVWQIEFDGSAVTITAKGDNTRNIIRYNYNNGNDRFSCYASTSSLTDPLYLYEKVEDAEYTLEITGYSDDNVKDGYNLIASPVYVNPFVVEGMTDGDFDFYYFDQSEEDEWRNYETSSFTLQPGIGYLYAKKATYEGQVYSFNLVGEPYIGDGVITLSYCTNEGVDFPGLNLIGNPFGEEATLNLPFYRMNTEGSALEAVEETGSTVNVMEGVFVYAEYDPDNGVTNYAQFTPSGSNYGGGGGMKLNVTGKRGSVVDNAIVRFDNGRQLPKFQLNPNSTKLYIPQGNKDYAIVRSAAEAEMPVSFKASENGTYTLAIETENVEMNYLHLIDNMTGMDVDLLQTPSYTFEAKTSDYASRFRLVFSANSANEQNAETFAYYNGSSWTVSNLGEATLQVVDVTGRTVSSETINGNATISLNQTPGVYMLRLVNGNSVKVQKVVVR